MLFVAKQDKKKRMQLFVRGQELHVLDVTGGETVADIKARVAVLDDLDVTDVAMYSAGRPLEDDYVLSACASDLGIIDVEVRMLGGNFYLQHFATLFIYLYLCFDRDSTVECNLINYLCSTVEYLGRTSHRFVYLVLVPCLTLIND
jgi:hypothetical protein